MVKQPVESAKPIKRTVAIHPDLDAYLREVWARLVKDKDVFDASYSLALNVMLLAGIAEIVTRKTPLSETKKAMWDFARNREIADNLKLHETMPSFKEYLEQAEFQGE